MSQTEKILEHLKSGRTLTPLEALQEFGCLRLAARVWELRSQGYDIQARDRVLPNGKHVAAYAYNGQLCLA